jgi:large subunit ribosomal protein L31
MAPGTDVLTRWRHHPMLVLEPVMKADIHPEYTECLVHCSCGNEFTTRSTVPNLRVELCSECHPFYTGKQKLVDTGGRVERFQRRYAKSDAAKKKK